MRTPISEEPANEDLCGALNEEVERDRAVSRSEGPFRPAPPDISESLLFRRDRKNKSRAMVRRMTATKPSTPPIIAPRLLEDREGFVFVFTFVLLLGGLEVGEVKED